ncbi:2-oxoadipate dioxygenase/decarboxylase [Frankia sp. AgKG'84/4]|uniref:2-oxoadipate dioxygenase/decarboxylase n=1 Tax=Frankia sp. AgKG'84/4 TaxID=573490 RepID=UPI002029C344|nr:VOC family protein [Frankia sp. AgKG'84/4]MCL9796394.1 VOC family protein [Frankia sp. AgKG'84/4]
MPASRWWEPWELRAEFSRRLSELYGREVPAYATLRAVSREINAEVLESRGADARRLGAVGRVGAERHGAVRVGTPREMNQVGRLFAAMGMHPVGFYDLRDAAASAVPVVSTAFRPVDPAELARNPLRMFTSLLVPGDRRFFTAELRRRLEAFLAARTLFPPRLLELADRAIAGNGLDAGDAEEFLTLAADALRLSRAPVDRAWYTELERVSAVAADIGGVRATHLNHLTPRVLDIDELYRRMGERGVEMIDAIQGPPRWAGPDLLLRQTSFRALAEPRRFRHADGTITAGTLRVRFGEVEARGIAATPRGRELYERLSADADRLAAEAARGSPVSAAHRAEIAADLWNRHVPGSESELARADLAYFTYTATDRRPAGPPPARLRDLVEQGWVRQDPIVYEDFLPRSAAGIFQSNLDGAGSRDADQSGAALDAGWLAEVLDRAPHDPYALYDDLRRTSLDRAAEQLDLAHHIDASPSSDSSPGAPA